MKLEIERLAEIMAGLGEIYGKSISTMMVDLYWEALRGFNFEQVNRAVQLHLRNPDGGQFFPRPADLMRHLVGSNHDKALSAWAKLDKAVRTVGPYRTVVFDDAVIHAVVVDMGGWIEFGGKDDEQWPFVQNEFIRRYRGYADKGGNMPYVAKLTGISEMHNETLGHKGKCETVLLGDAARAAKVLDGGSASITLGRTMLSELGYLSALQKPVV